MPDKSNQKHIAPFLSEDSEACFIHFCKSVAVITADKIEILNADPDIVRVNVGRGVDAVRPCLDQIVKSLPLLDVNDFLELPAISLALGFSVNRIFVPASPQEIRTRQQRLRPVRSVTLSYLEIVAELGLVPADPVKHIRANKGPLDEAYDAVAIAVMFQKFEAILAGKHPFTKEALQQLADDGNWLIKQLLPAGATPGKTERNADTVLRDRLWTDLVRRYDALYQAGVAIWGRRGVDEHIPALHARAVATTPKSAAAPSPTTPSPATTP